MTAVSLPSKVLGRKMKKFCEIILLKCILGYLGGGYYPPHPSALPDCQGVGVIASPKMPRAWLRL